MGELMACNITRPEPQVLFDRMRDMFSTTVLQGAPVIPESNEWYVVSLNFAVAQEFYAYSEQQWKEQDPRTACCDNLVKIAARDGVFLYAASFAQGYVQITGTPGVELPDSVEITIGTGTYFSETILPDVMPPEGTFIFRVRAAEAGQQGNGAVPGTGTLAQAIPGVSSTVTVFGGFCGGEDAETCEQFRSRYLARKQFAPRATAAWIEQKLLEWPCVTRVCVRGGTCAVFTPGGTACNGDLQYYVFMDNTFECGIPPRCVLDEINTWMFGPEEQRGYGMGQVEVGVCGKVYEMHPATINLTISDYGCISNAQKNEIRVRMAEYMQTLCPSSELNNRQFEQIVGSVLGFNGNYAVEIEPAEGADVALIGILGCGYELGCDAVACLGEVNFIDTVPETGTC
jgi:hypothetical protein